MTSFHFSSAAFWRMTALAVLLLTLTSPGWAARLALVIGNAGYAERPLKNPVNDATDLAKALEGAGFRVTLKTNLSADAMKEAISEFGDALRRSPDNTGLFYFSGHGMQTPKGNYLLPVGRAFKRIKDVELFAVEARAVLSEMQQARNPLNILILDACRDSPLPSDDRSAGGDTRGLAPMTAPSGSLIAFAAAPGKIASDNGAERNGLYTKHLIDAINTPGLRLEDVFKRVGARVEKESAQRGGDQSPEEVSKLRSEAPFYFRAAPATQVASVVPEPVRAPSAQPVATVQTAATVPGPAAATPGQVFKDCADCPEMVVIPGGRYMMGDSYDLLGRAEPVHPVQVQRFALGKFEITQGQWNRVMRNNPAHFKQCGDNCPVENVSWEDAQQFIKKLNAISGKVYRLPSEAEWEYAARGNSTSKWSFGNDVAELTPHAWFSANSGDRTHAVGAKQPNPFGVYDMHGNVSEWVEDWDHDDYQGAPADGKAWVAGGNQIRRVTRGGSWAALPGFVESAFRSSGVPTSRDSINGFRVARSLP